MEKQYEIAKKELLKDFLTREDNVIFARKIFIAISVLEWASKQGSNKEIYNRYLSYIGKYLYGEIDLYWEGDIIKFKAVKNITKGKYNDR